MTENSVKLVDAHFHLDLYKELATILPVCEARGVYTAAVTDAPSVFAHTQRLTGQPYESLFRVLGTCPIPLEDAADYAAVYSRGMTDVGRLLCSSRFDA